jgi:hypothetical protein
VNGARAVVAVAAPIALAATAMRVFETHAPASLSVELAQPLAVLTDAGRFGALQCVFLIAGLLAATVVYRMLIGDAGNRGSTVACGAVAVAICAWLVPIAFSSDVYAYAVYGEAALRGLDPFARLTLDGSNPLFAAARIQWGAALPACVYGWGFVAAAATVVGITAPLGVAGQIAGLRLAASLAMLACAPLAFFAFRGSRPERLRAAALIGCNPVAIWCAAEGHNDAIAVGLALFGCALASRRPQLGAALAGLAGAVKLPAVLAVVPAGVRRRAWIGALAGVALTVAASWPVATHWGSGPSSHGEYAPHVSLQALVFAVVFPAFGRFAAATVACAVALAISIALAAGAVSDLRRGRARGWIRLALAAWLLVPNPYPWYGLWLLAVAALAPRSHEAEAAIWLPLTALLRYLPDAAGLPTVPFELALDLIALLPFALLIPARRSVIINGPP